MAPIFSYVGVDELGQPLIHKSNLSPKKLLKVGEVFGVLGGMIPCRLNLAEGRLMQRVDARREVADKLF